MGLDNIVLMTKKEFLHQLRRGIGSAIVELRQSPDRDKYKELVLRCCLKDIGYDVQVEGTKGHYLYLAISALGCQDEFLDAIAEAYMKRLPLRLFLQLTDILESYARDGSLRAVIILSNKYIQLKERFYWQKSFPYKYWELTQLENLMIILMNFRKWKSFTRFVDDAGSIILARKDDFCFEFDELVSSAKELFGSRRVRGYLSSAASTSPNVRAFIANSRAVIESAREAPHIDRARQAQEARVTVTLKSILDAAAHQATVSDGPPPYALFTDLLRFARAASSEQLIDLANHILAEDNPTVKALLLKGFHRVDYPLEVDPLLNMASSANDDLRQAAIRALKRIKNDQVHDLAVHLLEAGEVESGIELLYSNWRQCDDLLISKTVMKSQRVTHNMQQDLKEIYSNNRSNSCGDILYHVYRNGKCTYCRFGIVKAMDLNGVLSDKVLHECQFDSYDDTRQLVEELLRGR